MFAASSHGRKRKPGRRTTMASEYFSFQSHRVSRIVITPDKHKKGLAASLLSPFPCLENLSGLLAAFFLSFANLLQTLFAPGSSLGRSLDEFRTDQLELRGFGSVAFAPA